MRPSLARRRPDRRSAGDDRLVSDQLGRVSPGGVVSRRTNQSERGSSTGSTRTAALSTAAPSAPTWTSERSRDRTWGRSCCSRETRQDQPLELLDVDDLAAPVAEQQRRALDLAHHVGGVQSRQRRDPVGAVGQHLGQRPCQREGHDRPEERVLERGDRHGHARAARCAAPRSPRWSGSVITWERLRQALAISSADSMLRQTCARSGRLRSRSWVALRTTSQPSSLPAACASSQRRRPARSATGRCRTPPAARLAWSVVEVAGRRAAASAAR